MRAFSYWRETSNVWAVASWKSLVNWTSWSLFFFLSCIICILFFSYCIPAWMAHVKSIIWLTSWLSPYLKVSKTQQKYSEFRLKGSSGWINSRMSEAFIASVLIGKSVKIMELFMASAQKEEVAKYRRYTKLNKENIEKIEKQEHSSQWRIECYFYVCSWPSSYAAGWTWLLLRSIFRKLQSFFSPHCITSTHKSASWSFTSKGLIFVLLQLLSLVIIIHACPLKCQKHSAYCCLSADKLPLIFCLMLFGSGLILTWFSTEVLLWEK